MKENSLVKGINFAVIAPRGFCMEIVAALKEDHQAIKKIIRAIKKRDVSYAQKQSYYSELSYLVPAHAKAEEKVLYLPSENKEKLKDFAFEGLEEHGLIDELLSEMKFISNKNVWEAKLNVVCELLEHHLKEEEEDMFHEVQKVFPLNERRIMAEEYQTISSQIRQTLKKAKRIERTRGDIHANF